MHVLWKELPVQLSPKQAEGIPVLSPSPPDWVMGLRHMREKDLFQMKVEGREDIPSFMVWYEKFVALKSDFRLHKEAGWGPGDVKNISLSDKWQNKSDQYV